MVKRIMVITRPTDRMMAVMMLPGVGLKNSPRLNSLSLVGMTMLWCDIYLSSP